MLSGKKTYILSVVAAIYGISGFFGGFLEANQAVEIVLGSGLFAALRNGIK